ncbi:MAG: rhodanese-like domain-containing protein [Kangiellaceae bacterium]|nr:rhodanese-like domain-containing protein [Kangiellaceae bacterium]MCW8998737.1 rhodanese-like domain-containing protein [Kangiellaceae bacterium]MCW9016073.1 rhodanese-like domain-containing protein [Kangiellaceae bacterium]
MITALDLVKSAKQNIKECSNVELCRAIDSKKLIIDVREADEYNLGFIAHSINVPRGLIEFAITDHPKVKPYLNQEDISKTEIYLYCKSGGRSALAAQSLINLGFKNAYSLAGGIMNWEKQGLKIDTSNHYEY